MQCDEVSFKLRGHYRTDNNIKTQRTFKGGQAQFPQIQQPKMALLETWMKVNYFYNTDNFFYNEN